MIQSEQTRLMDSKQTRNVLILLLKAMIRFKLNVDGALLMLLLVACLPPACPHRGSKDNRKTAGAVHRGGVLWAHPELCPMEGENMQLVILVTSAPTHFDARAAVRSTWGQELTTVFFIGMAQKNIMEQIKAEDEKHGDIILETSWDSYKNLTLKVLSMLQWAASYCPRASHLLKTDDDVFINVPRMIAFIQEQQELPDRITKTIWGSLKKGWLSRDPPIFLPNYVKGAAYLMTMDTVMWLLLCAPNVTYINLEDAFITGLVAQYAGVRRLYNESFYNIKGHKELKKEKDPRSWLATHTTSYKSFNRLQRLLDNEEDDEENTTTSTQGSVGALSTTQAERQTDTTSTQRSVETLPTTPEAIDSQRILPNMDFNDCRECHKPSLTNLLRVFHLMRIYDKKSKIDVSDSLPDSKPDSTADSKPDSTPDSKPDSTPDSKPDSTPDSTPDSKPDSTPDSKPDSTPDSTPDSKPDSTPDSKPDLKPDLKPDSKPDMMPNPEKSGVKSVPWYEQNTEEERPEVGAPASWIAEI